MGIEYRGVICVGYDYDEAMEILNNANYEGDLYDFCEELGITSYSPYFDAPYEDCIFGEEVESSGDYCFTNISNVDQKIEEAIEKLNKKLQVSIRAKAYLMAHGW